MAFNWRKIFYPVASDLFAPHTHMQALAESATTIIPVTGHTERDALGSHASADSPVYVDCSDASHATPRLEVNRGGGWTPVPTASAVWWAEVEAQVPLPAATMTTVLTVALPASAPPGRYNVDVDVVTWANATNQQFAKVTFGATELPGTSREVGGAAAADVARSKHLTATHTGGALNVVLGVQVNPVAAVCKVGTQMRVTWAGAV